MARSSESLRRWRSELRRLARIELLDLVLFLTIATTIFVTWLTWFGWTTNDVLAGGHAASGLMPFLHDLRQASGDWRSLLYRPDLLGGIHVSPLAGILPITQWLAYAGLSITNCINGTFLTVQVITAFLCVRGISDLSYIWSSERGNVTTPRPMQVFFVIIIGTIVCGFSPVLFARISYGQASLIAGLWIFLGSLSLVLATIRGRNSLFLTLLVLLAFWHAFQSNGQQLIFYSILFGTPIILGLAWSLELEREPSAQRRLILRLSSPLVLGMIAFCLASPVFRIMFESILESYKMRGRFGSNLVYATVTSNWRDWIQSLFWTQQLIVSGRSPELINETIYPIGPLLLALALMPWRLKRWRLGRTLGVGLGFSLIWAMILASQAEPVASWLLSVLPPLKWFTIPQRAVLPTVIIVPIFAIAALMQHLPWSIRLRGSWPILLLPFVWSGTSISRELTLWLLMSAVAVLCMMKLTRWASLPVILLFLAIGTLFAAKERQVTPWQAEEVSKQAQHIGDVAQKLVPELKNPLNRTLTSIVTPVVGDNGIYLMNVSSLDGSWLPNARFLELFHAANGQGYNPMTAKIKVSESSKGFPLLRTLYNICASIGIDGSLLSARRIANCNRSAWFSRRTEVFDSIPQIAQALTERLTRATDIRATMPISQNDPIWKSKNRWPQADCISANVKQIYAMPHQQRILIDVIADQACPLTIATNFAEILTATRVDTTRRVEKLDLFPAYGSLVGLIVPPGVSRIMIEPRREEDPWTSTAQTTGATLAFIMLPIIAWIWPRFRTQV